MWLRSATRSDAYPGMLRVPAPTAEQTHRDAYPRRVHPRLHGGKPAGPGAVGSGEAPVGAGRTIFLGDIFSRFKTQCGQCHVEIQTGTKFPQIKDGETFAQKFDDAAMATMKSDDPVKMMPPAAQGGKPYSQRAPGDAVVELAACSSAGWPPASPTRLSSREANAIGTAPHATWFRRRWARS